MIVAKIGTARAVKYSARQEGPCAPSAPASRMGHARFLVLTSKCDENYYGGDCSMFCEAQVTCSGHGECIEGTCSCFRNQILILESYSGSDCAKSSGTSTTVWIVVGIIGGLAVGEILSNMKSVAPWYSSAKNSCVRNTFQSTIKVVLSRQTFAIQPQQVPMLRDQHLSRGGLSPTKEIPSSEYTLRFVQFLSLWSRVEDPFCFVWTN